MIASLLALTLTAAPTVAPRLLYEQRCLYCHSSELSERRALTPAQWKAMVESMRVKAPLLITRTDARLITRYIVETLKLVPAGVAPVVPKAVAARPRPAPAPAPVVADNKSMEPAAPEPVAVIELQPEVAPNFAIVSVEPEEMPLNPEDELAEQEGAALMQRRCSKCHTLNRVFNKLDTFERSMATVRRMRLKTGSGITASDLALIERFLRLDLEKPAKKADDS